MERLKVAEPPRHRPLPGVVPHPDLVDDHVLVALSLQLGCDYLHNTSCLDQQAAWPPVMKPSQMDSLLLNASCKTGDSAVWHTS